MPKPSCYFSLRGGLLLTSVFALGLYGGIQGTRYVRLWEEYKTKAQMFSSLLSIEEQIGATCSDALNNPDPIFQSEYGSTFRERSQHSAKRKTYFEKMRDKYVRATTRPWETIIPDPPEP